MKANCYAGLVATNTIRQNNSRKGSLDFILTNGGVIFNAISSQPWSGDAVVHVSLVNWYKGNYDGVKNLLIDNGGGNLVNHELETINSSLSEEVDVSRASALACNTENKTVHQGQTHGHSGFLLTRKLGLELLTKDSQYSEVIRPFLIGDELLGSVNGEPQRFVIDFSKFDMVKASSFTEPYKIVESQVLPAREAKAMDEERKNAEARAINPKVRTNSHHKGFYQRWWQLSYSRRELMDSLLGIDRYIACSRVSARPIFEFVSSQISPNDSLVVFALEDDYSFGVIHSSLHVRWYQAKCSTMKSDPRYTSRSIWDTFPFPQTPKLSDVQKVAKAAVHLREIRRQYMNEFGYSLRELYSVLESPGKHPIKTAQDQLDTAVLNAYGFKKKKSVLQQLLDLNEEVASNVASGIDVQSPGLPKSVKDPSPFLTKDCVKVSTVAEEP